MEIGKILSEIKKGTIIGLLLISFYGIGVYVYKNKNKNKVETKIEIKNRENNEINKENTVKDVDVQNKNDKIINGYRHKNGYVYKWSDNEKSAFVKRSLGYEKRFSKTASQEELDNGLKSEYCDAIKEIEKVDQKIVPGTDIPFRKATYTQVDDAYKEYLQKISQIRQVVSIIKPDNLDNEIYFETRIKCWYKGTNWNNANSKFKHLARDFYSEEVNDYYK
mgnify:FL=1